jgi:hypothetical protein
MGTLTTELKDAIRFWSRMTSTVGVCLNVSSAQIWCSGADMRKTLTKDATLNKKRLEKWDEDANGNRTNSQRL